MAIPVLDPAIEQEIQRLVQEKGYSEAILQEFAVFVLQSQPQATKKSKTSKAAKPPKATKTSKPKAAKPLSLTQLKEAIYQHFGVEDTKALKLSKTFQLATSGLGDVNLSKKDGWEVLYRKLIGILPNEMNEEGDGCINGINIFKYDMPWRAFGLDPKVASDDDVKTAYRNLSKIYHPDNSQTGDAEIFNRLTIFYRSLTEKF